jgi:hypothetical protein
LAGFEVRIERRLSENDAKEVESLVPKRLTVRLVLPQRLEDKPLHLSVLSFSSVF